MIKTLRITGVLAVVLTVLFLVLPAVFGVRGDELAEQFLSSPGAIEAFNEAKGQKGEKSDSQVSPLVKEAEAFGLYLNPPKPKAPPRPAARERSVSVPRPAVVSAKFDLIGTSYYELRPELSLALIDEPGEGLHWVRQSSKVGHLVIEQIKDGLVVVRDGQRTFELEVERPKKKSLVKGSISDARITSTEPSPIRAEEKVLLGRLVDEVGEPPPPWGERERDLMKRVSGDLEASEGLSEKARAERIFAELEAMRVGDEEARRLGRLGERLREVRRDRHHAQDGKIEVGPDVNEANLVTTDLNDVNWGEANRPETE